MTADEDLADDDEFTDDELADLQRELEAEERCICCEMCSPKPCEVSLCSDRCSERCVCEPEDGRP